MITRFSGTTAAERTDDTLATALQAGWLALVQILMKVFFFLPGPDITGNCPLISQLSWHVVTYVCKSMRTLEAWAGGWGKMWRCAVGLTPTSERDEASSNSNDYERGCIYHCEFHKSYCEMSESSGKVKPLDLCMCVLLCQGQKYHESYTSTGTENHVYRISQSLFWIAYCWQISFPWQ